ncbi:hypothetical protein DFH08DRAFT_828035 [Mycena albidolilacea]|uniref:Glycan binding protein Y3-like domain-containing protein n=1 Tax=Mycena albidolilacea TaxID=1033008 RepID=A0AAD6YX46_9AGAR|nr:hypothetical protein DFH08DRAFT_828035 [Mycena albidolilacea]
MLGLVSLALIPRLSRAYPQLTVNCTFTFPGPSPFPDCSQFFPAFCGSVGDKPVPPGIFIPNGACLDVQSPGGSCTIIGTNKATTPQVPSEKICFEALTTLNKTCGDGAGTAQAKGDGFVYFLEPLSIPCICGEKKTGFSGFQGITNRRHGGKEQ